MTSATIVKTTETTRTAPVPTWAALKTAYKAAEASGVKARSKAYDAVVRGWSLTSETETDSKGTVVARSDASRSREVLDALKVVDGGVFNLQGMRVGQVAKVYAATAKAGVDPFSEAGRALFTALDTVRKFDVKSLDTVANQVKGAPDKAGAILADGVAAAKKTAKERAAANKGTASKATPVKSLSDVTAFATAALPVVRSASATADDADKAALKAALEAMLAHLG